jgi:3-keto-disaccharide hydrolase
MTLASRICLAALGLSVLTLTVSAGDPPAAKEKTGWKPIFDGKSLSGWKAATFANAGKVDVKGGAILMEKGATMTGVAYTRGDFPTVDYEVRFESRRLAGGDFFCTTIFPVGETFCSFVAGGWGGTIVGLSNVNHDNASQNATTSIREFENGKWYRFRLRATKDRIKAWIDDDMVVDLDTVDRKIDLHGACDPCKPFGFATWKTTGAVRDVQFRLLTAK